MILDVTDDEAIQLLELCRSALQWLVDNPDDPEYSLAEQASIRSLSIKTYNILEH